MISPGNATPIRLEQSIYPADRITPRIDRGHIARLTDQIEQSPRLFDRIDFLTLAGAIVALFVALGTESWWALSGATTSKLFSVQVSPFYVHISAVGLPTTVPLAEVLGAVTRTVVLVGFVALFAASIRPTAWWRSFALCFGVCSIAELYLSFMLMFYWAQGLLVSTYGIIPPYTGTARYQTLVVGLDLNLYSSPLVSAVFGIPYYLGFISFGLVSGKTILKLLRERALQALAALLPSGSIRSVYLTPPYKQVWFSSGYTQFNPLQADPQSQTDDELLVSFGKLYEKVEPGGSLSIVLPSTGSALSDRLEKLMPQAGFNIEEAPGKPENELHFRKPGQEESTAAEQPPADAKAEKPMEILKPIAAQVSPTVQIEPLQTLSVLPQPIPPKVLETTEEPNWAEPRMTKLEKMILKSAVKIITDRKQPVPYRELLNEVYMQLVNDKIEFDSARQIEATLLSHNGRELQLVEEEDDAGLPVLKKWALGSQKMSPDRRGLPTLETVKEAGTKLPHLTDIFKRKKSRYKPKSESDDELS